MKVGLLMFPAEELFNPFESVDTRPPDKSLSKQLTQLDKICDLGNCCLQRLLDRNDEGIYLIWLIDYPHGSIWVLATFSIKLFSLFI